MAETFSPAETRLICAVIQSLTEPIKADWNVVAEIGGYANGGSANRLWNMLKAKRGIGAAGAKRKKDAGEKKGVEAGGEGTGDGHGPSPTKKTREGAKAKSPKVKDEDGEEQVIGEAAAI